MDNKNQIPTLDKFLFKLTPPAWVLNPQTPAEASNSWYREQEEEYYRKYGQEKIESTRARKEGE